MRTVSSLSHAAPSVSGPPVIVDLAALAFTDVTGNPPGSRIQAHVQADRRTTGAAAEFYQVTDLVHDH